MLMSSQPLKLDIFPQYRDPPPPAGLGRAGRRLWKKVLQGYHIMPSDLPTLEIACRQLDLIETARDQLRREGMTVAGAKGGMVKHPAIGIERDASALYLAAMKTLGLDVVPPRDGPGRPPGG